MTVSPGFRIVLLCIAAAILYGLVMDQFTVRICLEYFTVAHPPVPFIPAHSPTLLALFWGVAATWWVGLLLGVPLALACRAGSPPRLEPRYVVRPLTVLLLVMGVCTLAAGSTGYILALQNVVSPADFGIHIPEAARAGFVADAFAHLAAYAGGFIGGIVITILTVHRRRLAARQGKGMGAAL
jgi:hypothetical protein